MKTKQRCRLVQATASNSYQRIKALLRNRGGAFFLRKAMCFSQRHDQGMSNPGLCFLF